MARNDAAGCIGQLLVIPIMVVIGCCVDMCNNSDSSMIKDARSSGHEYEYRHYLDKHPNGEYVQEALDSIYSITLRMEHPEANIERIYNIANNDGVKGSRIERPIKDFLHKAVIEANSEYYWNKYIEIADEDFVEDAKRRMEELVNATWGTDALAWETAEKSRNASAYKKYMDLYPKGKHYFSAKKKYVQMNVNTASQVEHNELPSMERVSGGGKKTTITISNGTSYELSVFYSGPDYETISIPAGSSKSITIPNGTYNIAARVNEHSVRPCYGTETVYGGNYSVSYYISSSRY